MGRIRTTYVKRVSRKILEMHKDAFGKDFAKDKAAIRSLTEIYSKQLRNKITGAVLHLVKQKAKQESTQSE